MNRDFSDSSEEKDIKPLLIPVAGNITNGLVISPEGPKKCSLGLWHDGNRKSAFQPYKQPTTCTVLTNLQRGNTQAATPVPQPTDINFHTRAGQGEITDDDIRSEKCVDICDGNGLTALHWAANYGQLNAVKLLLAHGANLMKTGPDGETALHLGANGGHHDVVKFLLKEGADVNECDDLGNTPLMYAASGNHPHTCNELLQHDARIAMVNLCGHTAFDLAVEHRSNLVLMNAPRSKSSIIPSSDTERLVTRSELAEHGSRNDTWLAIQGEVYDITEFVDLHPGGVGQIMRGGGRDATELFMSMHPTVKYKRILKKHYIGLLCENPEPKASSELSVSDSDSDKSTQSIQIQHKLSVASNNQSDVSLNMKKSRSGLTRKQ